MKLLINGLQLSKELSGVQYYTKHLFQALEKINSFSTNILLYQSFSQNRIKRILQENFVLPIKLKWQHYKVYHSPNYVLPFFNTTNSVLTVHDLITFDLPELCQHETVYYFRLFLRRSIKKASRIIAVSNTVKKDLIRLFHVPEQKIDVIYHGIDPIYKKEINPLVLKKYKIPKKYILFVGNIEPKKNLERLIEAYHLLISEKQIEHAMVIVGQKGWKYKTVFKTIEKFNLGKRIIFTGYLPIEEMPVLYSMSDIFVFPSLYEGFGFPPLEAMACEVPVLVSNKGSLPEITGGNALQVNPYNVKDIAYGMHSLLIHQNIRNKNIKEGKKWVKQFTWENTAKKTMEVYKQIVEKIENG